MYKQNSKTSIATQMPLSHSKLKIPIYTLPLNKSNSNNKFTANALQKSNTKEVNNLNNYVHQAPYLMPNQLITSKHLNEAQNPAYTKSPTIKTRHPKIPRFLPITLAKNSTNINLIVTSSVTPREKPSKLTPTNARVTAC